MHSLRPPYSLVRVTGVVERAARRPSSKNVHRLRGVVRRIETWLHGLPVDANAPMLKALARVRHRAGKVRDLDVARDLLKQLGSELGRSERRLIRVLDRNLRRTRGQQAQKLLRAMGRRRFRASLQEMVNVYGKPSTYQALPLDEGWARRRWIKLLVVHAAIADDELHARRKELRQLRYEIEMRAQLAPARDPRSDELRHIRDKIKACQDALGEWHDWLDLSIRAERLLAPGNVISLEARAHARRLRSAALVLFEANRLGERGKVEGENRTAA